MPGTLPSQLSKIGTGGGRRPARGCHNVLHVPCHGHRWCNLLVHNELHIAIARVVSAPGDTDVSFRSYIMTHRMIADRCVRIRAERPQGHSMARHHRDSAALERNDRRSIMTAAQ